MLADVKYTNLDGAYKFRLHTSESCRQVFVENIVFFKMRDGSLFSWLDSSGRVFSTAVKSKRCVTAASRSSYDRVTLLLGSRRQDSFTRLLLKIN